MIDKVLPDTSECMTKDDLVMRRNFENFRMIRGVLYRVWKESNDSKKYFQLVLPEVYRRDVLKGCTTRLDIPDGSVPYHC